MNIVLIKVIIYLKQVIKTNKKVLHHPKMAQLGTARSIVRK